MDADEIRGMTDGELEDEYLDALDDRDEDWADECLAEIEARRDAGTWAP